MAPPVLTTLQPESAFRRLTRYAGGENRLTEVLAAAFEEVPLLAWHAARMWTGQGAAPRERSSPANGALHDRLANSDIRFVRVVSQVPTANKKVVDLQLRFGTEPTARRDDVVIWVENKHGARLHDNQINNYLEALPCLDVDPDHRTVVFLAPHGSLPSEDVPAQVPQRSWISLGHLVGQLLPAASDPIDAYVLKECLTYMQDEQLTDPPVITPELLVALRHATAAESALVAICEQVSTALAASSWKEADDREETRRKPAFGWNYYESWNRVGSGDNVTLWLDWNASDWPSHPFADGRSLMFSPV